MPVQLDEAEVALLSEVLESRLREYSQQIASADESSFREQLQRERDSLQEILTKIQPS